MDYVPPFLCEAVEWVLGLCGEGTLYCTIVLVVVAVVIPLLWMSTEVTDAQVCYSYSSWLRTILPRVYFTEHSTEQQDENDVREVDSENENNQTDWSDDGVESEHSEGVEYDVIDENDVLEFAPENERDQTDSSDDNVDSEHSEGVEIESAVQFNEPNESSSTDGVTDESQVSEGFINIRLVCVNGASRLVQSQPRENIGDFKRRHFSEELSSDKLIRLIFKGKMLGDDKASLSSLGFSDNCYIHYVICNRPNTEITNHSDEKSQDYVPPQDYTSPPDTQLDDQEDESIMRHIMNRLILIIVCILIIILQIWFIDVPIDIWYIIDILKLFLHVFGILFANIILILIVYTF